MSFQLSTDTLAVLKNFATINQSLVFQEGSTLATISFGCSIIAKAKITEYFDTNFGIYDLNKFLSVLSMLETPIIEPDEKVLKISSGRKRVNYVCAATNLIFGKGKHNPYEKNIELPSVDLAFNLTAEQLADIKKGGDILNLPEIVVYSEDNILKMKAIDRSNPTGDEYTIEIGDVEKDVHFVFRKENLKLLPFDYTVAICAAGITKFTSDSVEYFIALEKDKK